jgi:hypothetical protein
VTVDDAYRLLALCEDAMPPAFPKPALLVHQTSELLVKYLGDERHEFLLANGYQADSVAGIADAEHCVIHIPRSSLDMAAIEFVELMLHEIGHLRQAQLHGNDSEQYLAEKPAERFARAWMKRVRVERAQ